MRVSLLFIVAQLFFLSCKEKAVSVSSVNKYDCGMVVSAHSEASNAGAAIMKMGGNAFDAAIATHFALAVTYPVAGNIGGGGFAVIRTAEGENLALDFREIAPMAYMADVFLDSAGNADRNKSLSSVFAAGVPGAVEGMWQLHQKFGEIDWNQLIQPSIKLAEKGFTLTKAHAERLNYFKSEFIKLNDSNHLFLNEKAWAKGDVIKQSKLAELLKIVAQKGRDGFYEGKHAQDLADFVQSKGGLMTVDDLKNYEAKWRTAYEFDFEDWHLISMPLPSSGGILMHQILKMIEILDINVKALKRSEYVHLISELERRAYADRSKHLGDSDFWNVNLKELVDDEYLKSRLEGLNMEKASKSDSIAPGVLPYESMETTHFSVVDNHGNAVGITTTVNAAYGSKIFVPEYGYVLNNEMDDFSSKPGVPNQFGLLGSEANKVEGGKRPLSSMTPTIVLKQDELKSVIGSPGGSTIITTVLQTVLNNTTLELDIESSVENGRFHHQWQPDRIVLEKRSIDSALVNSLIQKGHSIDTFGQLGNVNAIEIKQGKLYGAADTRAENAIAKSK
ncbi:MAG: gamma-glutamyltransferase [Bacteroidia bacterium]